VAKKKKAKPEPIPGLAAMTPEQRQQLVDMYQALRKHFSKRKKKGKKSQ